MSSGVRVIRRASADAASDVRSARSARSRSAAAALASMFAARSPAQVEPPDVGAVSIADGDVDEPDRLLGRPAVRSGHARHRDGEVGPEPFAGARGHRQRDLGAHRAMGLRARRRATRRASSSLTAFA